MPSPCGWPKMVRRSSSISQAAQQSPGNGGPHRKGGGSADSSAGRREQGRRREAAVRRLLREVRPARHPGEQRRNDVHQAGRGSRRGGVRPHLRREREGDVLLLSGSGETDGRRRQDHQPVLVHHGPDAAGVCGLTLPPRERSSNSAMSSPKNSARRTSLSTSCRRGRPTPSCSARARREEQKQRFAQMAALGRLGQPQDIADVVALLVSEDARWITGQNIRANGGTV